MPQFLKTMDYLPIEDIDFTSAKGLKRKLDEVIDTSSFPEENSKQDSFCNVPTEEEKSAFYRELSQANTKPAILSLIPEYSHAYIPKTSLPEFPQPLIALYDPNFLKLGYHELLQKCVSVSIVVSPNMTLSVERETKQQSKSKLWFKYRSGRVTASKMKSVCHTDPAKPSQTLIKQICYPQSFTFRSRPTDWGCTHEQSALNRYERRMTASHTSLKVESTGLFINSQWPFIGATPDAKVSCTCCGVGFVEIKCPYCHRGESIESSASGDKKFCLKKGSDGNLHLDRTHAYYYQVQTQLFVGDADYCDLCVCTFTQHEQNDLNIERIYKNYEFWDSCVTKVDHFIKMCILPELLGKWYTRSNKVYAIQFDPPSSNASSGSEQNSEEVYCYCKEPEKGEMIGCDNKDCPIEWFHFDCLKIKSAPKVKWYCPDCRKLPQFTRRAKRRN